MSGGAKRARLPRGVAALWGVSLAGLGALAPAASRIAPALPACPVRVWTGLPCPTCGATRALLALSHGAIGAALAWNPLVTVGALGFAAGGVVACGAALLGRDLPEPRELPLAARLAAVAALSANWIYLLADGR